MNARTVREARARYLDWHGGGLPITPIGHPRGLARRGLIGHDGRMSLVIAVVGGSVLLLAVGVWAWISREGVNADRDMGTISGQWINEHRSQERQSNDR